MLETVGPSGAVPCPGCGTELAPRLLACPNCQRLVHGEQLKGLAAAAEGAECAGDLTEALARWREALELLPAQSRQHAIVSEKVAELGRRRDAAPATTARDGPKKGGSGGLPGWGRVGGVAGLGGLALLLWKFKFAAVFLATKAKFLLLGLTKASTFLTMFLSAGVYWSVFGWPLALGLVLSIYVHEMGHVAALMRYGVRATAPLFVPGLGAIIRLRQELADPRQDSRVGLAGPLWGLGAAGVSAALSVLTRLPIFAAIGQLGAWINLFNLLPLWQLDGGRAFRSLTRPQRWLATAAVGVVWAVVSSVDPGGEAVGMLVLIGVVAAVQAAAGRPAAQPDPPALALYAFLVGTLSALASLPVPVRR